jgi:hypothetical protein
MRAVASFLGLSWHACLTESSFNGLAYGGDQLAIGQSGPQAKAAPSSAESDAALDGLDRYVLRGLLAKFRREFGYGETGILHRLLVPLLVAWPTRLERLALAASLGVGRSVAPASPRPGTGATLRQMFARQRFSYRHLLCEALPGLRARLPLPVPLSLGLSLPAATTAPNALPLATAPHVTRHPEAGAARVISEASPAARDRQ